jgi:putative DNA primase/helicase
MQLSLFQNNHAAERAFYFLCRLADDAMLSTIVLTCRSSGGVDTAAFQLEDVKVQEWIAARMGKRIDCTTGTASDKIRLISITVPRIALGQALAFRPAPAIIAEMPTNSTTDYALAWRMHAPQSPARAIEIAHRFAEALGGKPLGFTFPVPGPANVSLVQHLIGPDHWALVMPEVMPNGPVEAATAEPLVTSAANITMRPVPWLWPSVIALSNKEDGGCYYLIGGEGGMGKTTLAAGLAAIVSRGAEWPDGAGNAPRGSVAIGELEDAPSSAMLPRLQAAGADLSKIHFVKHVDLSTDIEKLDSALAHVADLRLLILSPFLEFIGEGSNDAQAVLARLRPMKDFAARRGAAVIGIMHPKDEGGRYDLFSGPKAVRTNSRGTYALTTDPADDNPIIKARRRMMIDGKVNNAPDGRARYYRIEGVTLPGGIETSRVVFVPVPMGQETAGHAPDLGKTEEAMAWLRAFLASGPKSGPEVKQASTAAGIKKGTLHLARDNLGIITEQIPNSRAVWWRLP